MRLDYGNATLFGIPQYQFDRFQSVMNAAARLVFSASRYDHITPLLRQLHWLRAPERVEFKLAVLVYKCRQQTAPSYLFEELCQPADFEARRRLRSASSSSLVVRRTRLSTVSDRAFPVVAARIWNGLPPHVTSAPSLPVFRSRRRRPCQTTAFCHHSNTRCQSDAQPVLETGPLPPPHDLKAGTVCRPISDSVGCHLSYGQFKQASKQATLFAKIMKKYKYTVES